MHLRPLFVTSLGTCALLAVSLLVPSSRSSASPTASQSPVLGTSSGCPTGFKVWVPSESAVSAEGAVALIPPDLSTLAAGATNNPALKTIIELHPTWLSTFNCKSVPFSSSTPDSLAPAVHPSSVRSSCESSPFACSPNWNGYADPSVDNGYKYFSNAYMTWKAPSIKGPNNITHAVSIWPGIGTGNSSRSTLIQAGSQSEYLTYFDHVFHIHLIYAWMEVFPGGYEKMISNLPVHAGTTMFVDVEYEPGKKGTALFFICAGKKCGEASKSFDGKSGQTVEWIAERPTLTLVHSKYVSLDRFGRLLISGASASESNSAYTTYFGATGGNSDTRIMTNCRQTQWLAVPERLRRSAFTDAWKNYGPSELCHRYPD
jgi:hypothetical protein